MTEKTTLLPSAPEDVRFVMPPAQGSSGQQQQFIYVPPPTRIILAPGLEFDATRKFRYGLHSLFAALLWLVAFGLVELRNCNFSWGSDLDKLQALHIGLLVFAFTLYLLSLFGIADFLFQYKIFFFLGLIIVYLFVGISVWLTYEAAVNPCKGVGDLPVDFSPPNHKNVFSRQDVTGIIVLLLDIFAAVFIMSAATSFHRRY